MNPAARTARSIRFRSRIAVVGIASCASILSCGPRTSDESLGSSEGGEATAAESSADPSAEASSASESVDESGPAVPRNPFEDAAEEACAVRDAQVPVVIPSGEAPYQETGFGLGNEFPHRFILDTTFVPLLLDDVPDGFVCYLVYPGQDDGQEWWFVDYDWVDPDGKIGVFMATQGVSDVLYYSGIPGHAPVLAPSVEFDASDICPQLPRVWTPDPVAPPEDGRLICVLPTSDRAEFVFIRIP